MRGGGRIYRPDRRTARDVVAELSRRAGATPLAAGLGAGTWADLLFDGEGLADEREASQSLLLALARLHADLGDHYDTLPARARAWYLEERLGIPRLEPLPDRVVTVVEGDPKRLPASLPKGALLKAGKTRSGGERLFATTDELTVTGASVSAVRSYRIFDDADVATSRGTEVAEAGKPFHPFGETDDPAAPHRMYIASDLLAFRTGTLTVELEFEDVGVSGANAADAAELAVDVLDALHWELAAPVGDEEADYVTPSAPNVESAEGSELKPAVQVSFELTGGSAAMPLAGAARHHLRASFPAADTTTSFSRESAFNFTFATVRIRVTGEDVVPEAGFFNEGLLDLTKEFQPFGPVPRRGDGFYLRSDEAFGKPLSSLTLHLTPLAATTATLQKVDGGAAQIQWQRRARSGWETMATKSSLGSVGPTTIESAAPLSEPVTVGGAEGRYVRGFLSAADFGWQKFQQDVSAAIPKIVKNEKDAKVPDPPEPPILSSVRIGYTSMELIAAPDRDDVRVFARNGVGAAEDLTADAVIKPFKADLSGYLGTMYLGLADAPRGEVLTVYLRIDEADACAAIAEGAELVWEYRDDEGGWSRLECLDGTLGLRQSGILRFVSPLDWAEGAREADAQDHRWLRARTQQPQLAGRVTQVRPDAVVAVFQPPPGAGEVAEPPLPPGGISGLKAAVPGIKAVANPAPSWGARGAESDPVYFRRASGALRHRNRAIAGWDLERIVTEEFPELARARCLPHHSYTSECAPGWAALVLVPSVDPDLPEARLPHPSVLLSARVAEHIGFCASPHLNLAVLCPSYREVGIAANLLLRPGLSAGPARERIERDLRRFLHPASGRRFGAPLFRSEVVRFLEEHRDVEFASGVDFLGDDAGLDRTTDVDPCRGLVASAAAHLLIAEAQL